LPAMFVLGVTDRFAITSDPLDDPRTPVATLKERMRAM
jgi:hypothetical protein